MSGNPFTPPGSEHLQTSSTPRPPADIFAKPRAGGAAPRRPASAPPPEAEPEPLLAEPPPAEEKPKDEDKAVLKNPAWRKAETRFHEEAEVSVELALPAGKEHVTRVEAELHAKTAAGSEVVARGESHAGPHGKAAFILPVHYPTDYVGRAVGAAVDYFLVFKHRLAKTQDTQDLPRPVTDFRPKAADYSLVTGIAFEADSSFIGPQAAKDLKRLEGKFKEWQQKFPQGRIVVFGHAEKDEKEAKALSERRARSAYAFVTNDAVAWEEISEVESWSLAVYQVLLKETGHDPGRPDGKAGPRTRDAFRTFQKQSGLPESGQADAPTRRALFGAYMRGKHNIQVDASRFRMVDTHAWMGCGSRNRLKDGDGAHPENRRVAFLLIDECKAFPVHFPCQDGKETACEHKCHVEGVRSAPGILCWFYDRLVREEAREAGSTSAPDDTAEPQETKAIYSVEKAVAHLDANAHEESQGRCARYVRLAIEAGGGKIPPPNPVSAKDYGPKLEGMGFKKISAADYIPEKGDLAVFQAPSTSPHGHIQMFNGSIWVSDFRQDLQKDIYPGPKYREEKVSYELFRP